jgi:hypothetical protein
MGVSPYAAIENEAPPKLIVDPTPLAAGLVHDIVWIQYHAENARIVPVFGTGALNVSPRIGHLHVRMDDLPWGWVEATPDNNTISVAGLPPGQHKMLVELVDANHHVFAGCAECRQTVTFTVPGGASPTLNLLRLLTAKVRAPDGSQNRAALFRRCARERQKNGDGANCSRIRAKSQSKISGVKDLPWPCRARGHASAGRSATWPVQPS